MHTLTDTTEQAGLGLFDGSEVFTPIQIAKGLGISKRTLDRFHAKRMGPPRIRIGKKILYRRSSVIAWLEAREEEPRVYRKRRGVAA